MVSAILVLLLLPLLNTSFIRSSTFRPIYSILYWFLVSDFLILGWIGQKAVESPYIEIGMISTTLYFIIFFIILPCTGFLEDAFRNKSIFMNTPLNSQKLVK